MYHDSHLTPSAQVPLPFVNDGDRRTVDDIGADRIFVRQPGSGLEKRLLHCFYVLGQLVIVNLCPTSYSVAKELTYSNQLKPRNGYVIITHQRNSSDILINDCRTKEW